MLCYVDYGYIHVVIVLCVLYHMQLVHFVATSVQMIAQFASYEIGDQVHVLLVFLYYINMTLCIFADKDNNYDCMRNIVKVIIGTIMLLCLLVL